MMKILSSSGDPGYPNMKFSVPRRTTGDGRRLKLYGLTVTTNDTTLRSKKIEDQPDMNTPTSKTMFGNPINERVKARLGGLRTGLNEPIRNQNCNLIGLKQEKRTNQFQFWFFIGSLRPAPKASTVSITEIHVFYRTVPGLTSTNIIFDCSWRDRSKLSIFRA